MLKRASMTILVTIILYVLMYLSIATIRLVIFPATTVIEANNRLTAELSLVLLAVLVVVIVFVQRRRIVAGFYLGGISDLVRPRMLMIYTAIYLFIIGSSIIIFFAQGALLSLLELLK